VETFISEKEKQKPCTGWVEKGSHKGRKIKESDREKKEEARGINRRARVKGSITKGSRYLGDAQHLDWSEY